MKTNTYTKWMFIILLNTYTYSIVFSEGTKQFRPTSADYGNLQINDQNRPFALESNNDSMNRLYFHISNVTEKVYFGFQHVGSGTATFRIKNPSGTTVYARTTVPSSGAGYISSYNQAVAGPKIGGVPVNGYTPFVFQPIVTGDFYIEFTTNLSSAYHFDLFDLTVTTSLGIPINGRLWSYAWDLNTRSYNNRYKGSFYIYSSDRFVSRINMNGIQPFGFVVSCNSSGPGNSALGDNENRKSVAGNSTRPEYKVFLNNPDTIAYPSGAIPVIMKNLHAVGAAIRGQPITFSINMSRAGTVELIIDLDGNAGYQPNTKDIILVRKVDAGNDTIIWDGKDGLGNLIDANTQYAIISASFSSGNVHFPIFDPETNDAGYIVDRIRPIGGSAKIYWDDSSFDGGDYSITGAVSPAHLWANMFGDARTMNTWWDGFRLDNINQFSLNFSLPISLLSFNAILKNNKINIEWVTTTETNNEYFYVQRSTDAKNFTNIEKIKGAGNSNKVTNYSTTDEQPIIGKLYYRLKQIDFDGKYSYSKIVTINNNNNVIQFSPNPVRSGEALTIRLSNSGNEECIINIISPKGDKVLSVQTETINGEVRLMIPLERNIYKIFINTKDKSFNNTIIVL